MFWPILVLGATVAGLPFLAERRKPDMTDRLRRRAPGQFAQLSDGATHYQWFGPSDGPVVVCVHGLTTPSYVFDLIIPAMIETGHRVLTYDLYGRGFSDRPAGAQTRHFFMRQLRDLLQDQGVDQKISLVGFSMGGAIVTVFAFEEPERVDRMILLAPAGLKHTPDLLSNITRRVPGLGDWLMLALGGHNLRRGSERQKAHASIRHEMARRQTIEISRRGYLPAVLSSARNMVPEPLIEEHRAIAAAGIPVAAIWGELDDVIPQQAVGRLTELNRKTRQVVIKGAGHGLVYTHAPDVAKAVVSALADPRDETV